MNLSAHITIIREALGGPAAMERRALLTVIAANCATDLYQDRAAWHFDSAPDRQIICQQWRSGLNAYLERAVTHCAPEGRLLKSRWKALWAFGRMSHMLQDFYAHTNWIELHLAQGAIPPLAPLLHETIDVEALPETLSSGYFSLRYFTPKHHFSGCPTVHGVLTPPPGFAYCHAQLAKDSPSRGHGQERAGGQGASYFTLAMRLAIAATLQAWQELGERAEHHYWSGLSLDGAAILSILRWGR